MKCEQCERIFESSVTKKIIRGVPHNFCSEYCYVLYFWKIPKQDLEPMYKMCSPFSFSIRDIRELIEEV